MTFSSLGLSADLLRVVSERNYLEPTPIQKAAIPAILEGRDVWACAQTGSGKTAAFALPVLQQTLRYDRDTPLRVRTLILVPTRELAAQVGESIRLYARYLPRPAKTIIVFGGLSINPQMMALRGGADIVVATPGRLLDLVDHNALRLADVTTLVLDEADRLLDLGFTDELVRVLEQLPPRRQNLLFSATFPPAVHRFAERLLHDPIRIDVPSTTATRPAILQRSIQIDPARRTQLLRHLIIEQGWTRILVFVSTQYSTEHIAKKLRRAGIPAAAFHGKLSQGARTKALADFKAGRVGVLIATDVAARGIDIAQLPAVVNYDLPRSTADYTHRIGRTGRAGESGVAVSFVTASAEAHFRLIEKRHGIRLTREIIAGFEVAKVSADLESVDTSTNGIEGRRKPRS
jgi:ATP-dependent RNA helicase RhlE